MYWNQQAMRLSFIFWEFMKVNKTKFETVEN